MIVSEKKLMFVIRQLLKESEKQIKKNKLLNTSLGIDPRYSSEQQKVPAFPQNEQYKHEEKIFPKIKSDWAQWVRFPTDFLSKKYCWIPPEKIPNDFILPLWGASRAKYIDELGVFKMEAKSGRIAARPMKSLSELIKQLRNTDAWAYGPITQPMPDHPKYKGTIMIPLEWSVLFAATEKRAIIMAKKIKSKEQSIFYYTKRNGYGDDGKAIGRFRKALNSVIRNKSLHVSREEGIASNKSKKNT